MLLLLAISVFSVLLNTVPYSALTYFLAVTLITFVLFLDLYLCTSSSLMALLKPSETAMYSMVLSPVYEV